ncbi:MAG: hypothetical protein EOP06_02000 [Proteobacteria bacterium]|nr:MAG: hypothetical protein EOP06_02000 [Pseudomonadota bacterium]
MIELQQPMLKEFVSLLRSTSLEGERPIVLDKAELAKVNTQYHYRLVYGAQWRADIVRAIDEGAKNPSELSRLTGASYEPCYRVWNEWKAAGKIR